jgi:Lysylphosphatidylglycerol synthase TM region
MVGLVWYELRQKQQLSSIWQAFQKQGQMSKWPWLAGAIVLMPFNWFCEVLKWQPLVQRYTPLSMARAFSAVFAGVSVSLFTPNRVGEFGGRLLFVPPKSRWQAALINFTGNLSQFMVLLSAGCLGAVWFAKRFLPVDLFYGTLLSFIVAAGLVGMYLLFFNIRFAVPLIDRLPLPRPLQSYRRHLTVLAQFSRRDLWFLQQWSWVRYGVYSTQYYFLLNFFGIKTGLLGGYAGIATIFLLQSGIPLPPLAGLLARGVLAIHIWAYFGADEVSSLATTFTLWIINLIFAAFIGTFFLLRVNISKAFSYEDD